MKFGIRIHWGIYSIWHRGPESWPFLTMSFEDRQTYNNLYKTWNPAGFDADAWMDIFKESGMKMFAFTTKHHEGFSMFDTKTRVKNRANWTAAGGPRIESCDLGLLHHGDAVPAGCGEGTLRCRAQTGHQDRSLFLASGLV